MRKSGRGKGKTGPRPGTGIKRTQIHRDDYLVDEESGCWLWLHAVNSSGYGVVSMSDTLYCAHVVMYKQMIGPVPDGLELDHVDCISRRCINPSHLEPVTRKENLRRGREKKNRTSP